LLRYTATLRAAIRSAIRPADIRPVRTTDHRWKITMTNPTTITITMTDAEAGNLCACLYPVSGLLGRRDDFETVDGMTAADHIALGQFLSTAQGTVHETGDRYLDAFVLRTALRRRDGFAEIMYDTDRSQYVVVATAAWHVPAR
jgi:hypothetical protein